MGGGGIGVPPDAFSAARPHLRVRRPAGLSSVVITASSVTILAARRIQQQPPPVLVQCGDAQCESVGG
jgi:hypothetical protein